jgi:glucose/arabinose dehydrogenase
MSMQHPMSLEHSRTTSSPPLLRRGLEAVPRAVAVALAVSILLAAPVAAQPPLDELELETLTTDLPGTPVAITHAGDSRLFITLKEGLIVLWDGDRVLEQPFLDLRDHVSLEFEQGLLSTAFHPDFADNGLFFVDYTDLAGDTVIARYRVSGDPNRADAASAVTLLHIPQPFANHNGGQLQFGPDGFLYIGLGDGGSANDPMCNAQRPDTLLGKILRIDVDAGSDQPPFYGIPPGNPFAGPGDPPDEVWVLGLRNPWRFSFDRATGDLYIADVGQNVREEVDFQPAGSSGGENYGWKVMEGTLCQSDRNCPLPVPPCNAPAYTDPILEYDHSDGDCSVVGGYVYRGSAIDGLDGVYFYGDFCSGDVRAAERLGADWTSTDLDLRAPNLTTFGEDVDGELYLAGLNRSLFRLVGPGVPPPSEEPGRLELVGGDREALESAGSVTVEVVRLEGDDGAVSVRYTVGGGDAAPGEDYLATEGTLRWADGEAGTRSFEIPLVDDALPENPETVEVSLHSPGGGAVLGEPRRVTLTLLDDDLTAGPCVPGPTTLCLAGGRFRVETRWETREGDTGPGMIRSLTGDTGTFWFFDPDNLEVVVKVIDACGPPFDRFWVFAGGLTNVGVTLTVVDTEAVGTGKAALRRYENPLGTPFQPIQDTQAFATCP